MGNYFNELRWKIIRANNLLQFIHQVTISELRVRLVEAFQYMYFFCWQFQGGADFVDQFLNLYFMFLCCLHLEIYMLKIWPIPCTVVVWSGRGRNQGIARLVLNGCGIAVPEIFGAIPEDSQWCVYVHISAHQIASNRSLSLMGEKSIVCASKRILANYSKCS